jgi:predicted dienelactone hydrolase
MKRLFLLAFMFTTSVSAYAKELSPLPAGPYSIASTNMEIADKHRDMTDEEMHLHLIGDKSVLGGTKYVADLMKYPDSAWIVDVEIPDDDLYGPLSGEKIDVMSYVTYPTQPIANPRPYDFPYHNSKYGSFAHMLLPDEKPQLAKTLEKYPLVILSHGSNAHGIYDIEHANGIARHGYIVAVITYGENRTQRMLSSNEHTKFLRPLITKDVIDSLLESSEFGPFIDRENIAISGFSFGGFTALAIAGGKINGETKSVHHPLISAAVATAPWTGGTYSGRTVYAFGDENNGLKGIDIPIITLFGGKDDVTSSESILPAVRQLKGPTYVVELIDQTHAFQEASWQDRNNWEILFLNAYLKNDEVAFAQLKTGTSMRGGNGDRQLFEYQNLRNH